LNIALLHNPSFISELDYELLINVNLMLITRKDNPLLEYKSSINADDLETIPLIIPSENNTFRQLLDSEMAKHHKKPNIVLEVDSKELILDLVVEGMGHSILLPMVLALGQTNKILTALPIKDPELPCHLYMATSNKLSASRLELALITIIQEVCNKYFPGKYPSQYKQTTL
jgi:LysR family nitrogen assimilation transcriptional regulator